MLFFDLAMNIKTSIKIHTVVGTRPSIRPLVLEKTIPVRVRGEKVSEMLFTTFEHGYRHQEGDIIIPFFIKKPLESIKWCKDADKFTLEAHAEYPRLSRTTVKILRQLGWN